MNKTVILLMLLGMGLGVSAQSGIVKEISGTVELKAAGAEAFVPAELGQRVEMNTVINTGFRSTALIDLGSALITVRPLTRLSLAEIRAAEGAEDINMNLRSGRVRVDVNPPAGTRTNFTVKSPNATASVRGTVFEFDTQNLLVREGAVAFKGAAGAVIRVRTGFTSRADGHTGHVSSPLENAAAALLPSPEIQGGAPVVQDVTAPSVPVPPPPVPEPEPPAPPDPPGPEDPKPVDNDFEFIFIP